MRLQRVNGCVVVEGQDDTSTQCIPGLSCLADVAFDNVRGPRLSLGWIAAGLAHRAPLTKQVPALVELDLNVRQSLAAIGTGLTLLEQAVLFSDQPLNVREHRRIRFSPFHTAPDADWQGIDV